VFAHTYKKYIEGSEENIATEKEGIVSAVEQTAFDCILVAWHWLLVTNIL
jgi:hypothetical protein